MDNVVDFNLFKNKKTGAPLAPPSATAKPLLVVEFLEGDGRPVRLRHDPEHGDLGPMSLRAISNEFLALAMALRGRADQMEPNPKELPLMLVELRHDGTYLIEEIFGSRDDGLHTAAESLQCYRALWHARNAVDVRRIDKHAAELKAKKP